MEEKHIHVLIPLTKEQLINYQSTFQLPHASVANVATDIQVLEQDISSSHTDHCPQHVATEPKAQQIPCVKTENIISGMSKKDDDVFKRPYDVVKKFCNLTPRQKIEKHKRIEIVKSKHKYLPHAREPMTPTNVLLDTLPKTIVQYNTPLNKVSYLKVPTSLFKTDDKSCNHTFIRVHLPDKSKKLFKVNHKSLKRKMKSMETENMGRKIDTRLRLTISDFGNHEENERYAVTINMKKETPNVMPSSSGRKIQFKI